MTKRTAATGISLCVRNAERLIRAGRILFSKNHRVGTALLVTAVEEYGKAISIVLLFSGTVIRSERQFKALIRNHHAKRKIASLAALVGSERLDGARVALNTRRIIEKLDFNAVRDSVLYVNYSMRKFVSPGWDVPNSAMVFRLALKLQRMFGSLRTIRACLELLSDDAATDSKLVKMPLRITKDFLNLAIGAHKSLVERVN